MPVSEVFLAGIAFGGNPVKISPAQYDVRGMLGAFQTSP